MTPEDGDLLLKLAERAARRIRWRFGPLADQVMDDIFGAAVLGGVLAAKRFDPTVGTEWRPQVLQGCYRSAWDFLRIWFRLNRRSGNLETQMLADHAAPAVDIDAQIDAKDITAKILEKASQNQRRWVSVFTLNDNTNKASIEIGMQRSFGSRLLSMWRERYAHLGQ